MDRAAKPQAPRERAHRDRIEVTPESPEGFEEVVWMAFFPHLHDLAASSVLDENVENQAFERFYRHHIAKLLLVRGRQRYLAKANYHITRLAYLRKILPSARFIVPVRDPLWHVASLMKQHALFCDAEAKDERVLRHMRRSGHFEFGLDRRAINTGEAAAMERIAVLWQEGREAEGWAEYWAMLHRYLARLLVEDSDLRAATLIVRYEDLCRDPAPILARILDHCSLPPHDLCSRAAKVVSAPTYYRPRLTSWERDHIRHLTGSTAKLFGYPD